MFLFIYLFMAPAHDGERLVGPIPVGLQEAADVLRRVLRAGLRTFQDDIFLSLPLCLSLYIYIYIYNYIYIHIYIYI